MTVYSLIVAGSGKVETNEVEDLMNNWVPREARVDLYFDASTTGYTPTVQAVVDWANNPTAGGFNVGTLPGKSKISAKAKDIDFAEALFHDPITAALEHDMEEPENTFLLLSLPDPEADDYDDLVNLFDLADGLGIPTKNLAAGLDDVSGEDPTSVPDPKPEPDEKSAEQETGSLEEDVITAREDFHIVSDAVDTSSIDFRGLSDSVLLTVAGLALQQIGARMAEEAQTPAEAPATTVDPTPPPEPTKPAEEPTEPPKSTRGRPRPKSNEQRQVLVDDEWQPARKGRTAKGTEWRTVDLDTDEVISEGTA